MKLSKRLEAILTLIPPFSSIVDVGTDHAHLICEALQRNIITKALAIDNKEGPLQSARENIKKHDLLDHVEFSLSSGLTDYRDTYQVVVIAGMGAHTMIDILTKDLHHAKHAKRMILQPNKHVDTLRNFLSDASFKIEHEILLEEKGKFYEILQVSFSPSKVVYTELDIVFGPILRKERNPSFQKKYKSILEKKEKQMLAISDQREKEKLIHEIQRIKEVL